MLNNCVSINGGSTLNKTLRLGLVIGLVLIAIVLLGSCFSRVAHADSPEDTLRPLPRDCTGVNPPGDPTPACCMYGYVHYASATLTEPLVVEGAEVILTSSKGVTLSVDTTPGWLNPEGLAYFHFNLDSAGVYSGEMVIITASYLDKQALVTHQVISDGQQVDVVLPEARGFDAVTVVVDDQDEAANPNLTGFYIEGPVESLTEMDCGPDAEFWAGTIYSGTSTVDGYGPPSISATYRPTLPISGTYELFAFAPHGCADGLVHYGIYIAGEQVITTVVDQGPAGQDQGRWISLGLFEFPAGTSSYVTVNNVTGQPNSTVIGFDALKWDFRTPFQPIITVTVDDLDTANTPDDEGFYKNDVVWGERTDECEEQLVCDCQHRYNIVPKTPTEKCTT